MFENAELYARHLAGGPLTEEEKNHLRLHSIRYNLVRALYMEKVKAEGLNLTDFHFSPGSNWENAPIVDIVNELLKFNQAVKDGNVKLVSGPPRTGLKKVNLNDN